MRTVWAFAAFLLLLAATAVAPANAAEFDDYVPVPDLLPFQSPAGDLTDEPSGLAVSRVNPGVVYWVDEAPRDGRAMIYAVDPAGTVTPLWFSPTWIGRPEAGMLDFEDLAVGPCDGPGSASCLWVGDIGHLSADFRAADKSTFWLYRIPEPDLARAPESARLSVTGIFPITVPAAVADESPAGGSRIRTYDLETLMVHPVTGEIYLVTKGQNTDGLVRVLRYPPIATAGVPRQLEVVTTIQIPHSPLWNPLTRVGEGFHLVTSGDIHPDGRRFLLRTYGQVLEFRGTDFASALTAEPVGLPTPPSVEIQGEAVAYSPDGASYYTLGERSRLVTRSLIRFAACGTGSAPRTEALVQAAPCPVATLD